LSGGHIGLKIKALFRYLNGRQIRILLLVAGCWLGVVERTTLFSQEVILLDASTNGQIRETCFANFYDNGGSGSNYSDNQDYNITFIFSLC